MVFASDLDMTLVYSERFLPYKKEDLIIAENKRDGRNGFMSKTVYNTLKEKIKEGLIFIPTTARDKERYKRLFILDDFELPFEITGNGRNIFKNGELDIEWENKIKDLFTKTKYNIEEVVSLAKNHVEKCGLLKDSKTYTFDDYLCIISFQYRDFFTQEQLEKLQNKLKDSGWEAYCCNRKLYISIIGINKQNALEYIKQNYLPNEKFYVAGDSYSDLDMLKWADVGIVPKHGDVAELLRKNAIITQHPGIEASIDIIKELKE